MCCCFKDLGWVSGGSGVDVGRLRWRRISCEG